MLTAILLALPLASAPPDRPRLLPEPVTLEVLAGDVPLTLESANTRDLLHVELAAAVTTSYEDFTAVLTALQGGGTANPTPLSSCISQAQSACGQGKVCWVIFSGNGSQQGSCSFGCAIAGAQPPCPPPPATVPPPVGTE